MTRATQFLRPAATNAPARAEPPDEALPRLHTGELFRAGNEVLIEHRGEIYRLRLTRQDKLILTK